MHELGILKCWLFGVQATCSATDSGAQDKLRMNVIRKRSEIEAESLQTSEACRILDFLYFP